MWVMLRERVVRRWGEDLRGALKRVERGWCLRGQQFRREEPLCLRVGGSDLSVPRSCVFYAGAVIV